MIGTSIVHYRILEKLGSGGMGVVYKARDVRLDRFVALKILPPETVADPDRKRRFIQEAKAASALAHPNIITIYDVGGGDGVDFIAMEYVSGKTLDELIGRKGLRLSEFLALAVQIADALSQAHANGIIHRDLKPSNIMVDEHGLVKVLDFGLAKLKTPSRGHNVMETLTLGPGNSPQTEATVVVGTAGYMSPEQAEGLDIDGRSDIFSLGAVLYEMITGQRAFHGETTLTVLTALLHDEPKPIHEVAGGIPAELERVILRCLRKDPRWRFQHMEDLKVALAELKLECDSGKLSSTAILPQSHSRRARWRTWFASALLASAAVAAGFMWWRSLGDNGLEKIRLAQLTWDSGLTTEPAISPDGKLVAYASDRSGKGNLEIWIQQLGGEPVRLTSGDGDNHEPSFSPDGTKIVFRSERAGGGIYVVPALGGEPRLIARQGRRPRFSPDGKWIAYYVSSSPSRMFAGPAHPAAIYVVGSSGGTAWRLQSSFLSAHDPVWSPEGKLLFAGLGPARDGSSQLDFWITGWNPEKPSAVSAPVQTGAARQLMARGLGTNAIDDWNGGRLVFAATSGDSRNLWEIGISPAASLIGLAVRRLTAGSGLERHASVASTGTVVFSSLTETPDIWSVPLNADGKAGAGTPERLTNDPALEVLPTLSADGRKLAFTSNRHGNPEVWLRDLETGRELALTASPVPKYSAVISRDGSKVAYAVIENRRPKVYVIPTSGGVPEEVCNGCGAPSDWSSDGSKLLLQHFKGGAELFTVDLLNVPEGVRVELLNYRGHALYRAHFSPDDRWIAVHADNARGVAREMVVPLRGNAPPDESEWISVTDGSTFDDAPRWSSDGNLLYYVSDRDGHRCIWAQRLEPSTKRPVDAPFVVQHFHGMRRSPANVALGALDICVAQQRLVVNLGEATGNIWMYRK